MIPDSTQLTVGDRLWLRWFKIRCWLRRCPDCGRRGWSADTPRWDEDRVVRAFGWSTEGRCGNCGKEQVTK